MTSHNRPTRSTRLRAAGIALLVAGSLLTVTSAAGSTSSQTEVQELLPSDNSGPSFWATAVAVDGDTLAVGSACCGDAKGLVDVFTRIGSVWELATTLRASDTPDDMQDLFGTSVAVDGDRIVVGATGSDPGAAYVFQLDGTTWAEQAILVGSDSTPNLVGTSVASSGDTIVVGAGGPGGGAFVFRWTGVDWVEEAFLAPEGDGFGYSVAVDGDSVVVGAFLEAAAYVYHRDDGSWSAPIELRIDHGHFGQSVAISEGRIFVGAPDPMSGAGAAYLFEQDNGSWTHTATVVPTGSAGGDFFGDSLALEGNTLVVGASRDFIADAVGSAHVYELVDGVWSEQAILAAGDGEAGDDFGRIDLSGSTVIVGASSHDHVSDVAYGAAYIFDLSSGADADADGVVDTADVCPGTTIPEAVPLVRLAPGRYALTDGDTVFDSGSDRGPVFTTADTGGCSAEQIISELELGPAHTRFGISLRAMLRWTETVAAVP